MGRSLLTFLMIFLTAFLLGFRMSFEGLWPLFESRRILPSPLDKLLVSLAADKDDGFLTFFGLAARFSSPLDRLFLPRF